MRKQLMPIAVVLALASGACSRSPQHYVETGNKFTAQGRDADAELNYRKAVQKDANFGEAYYQLGLLEIRRHNNVKAYGWLRTAENQMPNRDDVAVQMCDVALALYLEDPRHPRVLYDQVTTTSGQLLAANAGSFDGLRLKGLLASADKHFTEAEGFFSQANAVKPMQPQVMLGWTEALFDDGKVGEAESLASQLIDHDKTFAPIYSVLARYYTQARRPADTERVLKMNAANNPGDAPASIELAAFYGGNAREGDMKAVVQRMLDQPRTFPQARLQIGDLYVRLRRWNDAVAQYRAGEQSTPAGTKGVSERIAYLKRVTNLWVTAGKLQEAYQTAAEILREDPNDEAARTVQASLLLSTRTPDNVTKAVSAFRDLTAKDAGSASLHFDLGRALAAKGDSDGAQKEFRQAIQLNPSYLDPRLSLIEMSQSAGDYKSVLAYADQALNLNPNLSAIRLVRAVSLMRTGNEARGRKELDVLAREFPRNREVLLQLALADLQDKKFKDAEERLRKLADSSPGDIRPLKGLSDTLSEERETDKALALMQDEVRKSPGDLRKHALLASTAALAGNNDLAIQQYQELVAAAPGSGAFAMALSRALQSKGDASNALLWARKAEELTPDNTGVMVNLGNLLAASNNAAGALAAYRRALKIEPENPAALGGAAAAIAETGGSLDEALTMAQVAVRLDPAQPAYSDTLGSIYLKKKFIDSAEQVFRNLAEKYPGDPVYHYHLGLTLLQKGDRSTAKTELRSALAAKPNEDVRRKIEEALARTGN